MQNKYILPRMQESERTRGDSHFSVYFHILRYELARCVKPFYQKPIYCVVDHVNFPYNIPFCGGIQWFVA